MRQQPAAQAVIEELLRLQGSVPPRSWFGRVFGHSPLGVESFSWYRGAQGEIIVGGILATLPPEWTAFHALPVGKKGADIDHLVIGPGGILVLVLGVEDGLSVCKDGEMLSSRDFGTSPCRRFVHDQIAQ